ncbi:hypothetical protein MID13_09030 [Vibrio gigantis]|uniref:hypothetical protein n=1 Tax=Vibrio TaxID=662 RepID=UPI000C84F2BA|nr:MULTISPECIES: hypothetical protein [Vibrio]PMK11529.1 hypothetical protein BCU07_11805 [Vibrio sp. 10N.261.54.E10]ULN63077.1 hypothetical protein MID13_09030 [Vibrio gigantis]
MSLSEVMFSYDSAAGEEGIRTLHYEGKLYFSLFDVVRTIQRENRVLAPGQNSKTILTLLRAHITHLLPHEIYIRDDIPKNIDDPLRESYVTKAGLLRVVLQDNSPACLKFQEWVLEDVLPQILETGQYTHPNLKNASTVPSNEDFDVETMLRLQLQETIERKKADAELKKQINSLDSKLSTIERVVNNEELIYVTDDELVSELSDNKQYEVFSYCLGLCSKEPQLYRARRITGNDDIESKMFSRNTVDKAVTMVN